MPEKYSRETLVVTAAFSWCMKDFLEKLEVEITPRRRRHLASRLTKLGIDTSHWDRSPKRWYSDTLLASAVKASNSYAGALRFLGVPVTGGQHAHLARRIRAAGIDTSHFLGQAHNRGNSQARHPREILVLNPEATGRPRTATLRRAMLASGVQALCAGCGREPVWEGQPLILMIDHIDGNWLDNRLENLRFLCPNCHSQTSTWCRRSSRAA